MNKKLYGRLLILTALITGGLYSCGELGKRAIRPQSIISAAKNGMVNVIKECVVAHHNDPDSVPTFKEIKSSQAEYSWYDLMPIDSNSCFAVIAKPKRLDFTWFKIEYNPETGDVVKTCGDSAMIGCNNKNGDKNVW